MIITKPIFKLTEKYIKEFCQKEQRRETYRFLAIDENGFTCQKFDDLGAMLNERVEKK